jgi:thiol-disulfide isomerase/thioredoxin
MKNIALALSVCALFSCQEPANNTVIITGTITDPLSETASIISKDRSNTYTDSLDNKAAFEIEFEMDSPTYMSFKHGKETTAMYVKPGDKIKLSINPAEFDETISYEGSKASNFLAKKYLAEEGLDFKELYSLDETNFLAQVTEAESMMNGLLDSLVEGLFKTEQKRGITLKWARTKLNYKKYYEYFGNGTLELSTNYFDFMKSIDVNDPSLLEDDDSYRFLKTYVSSNISEEFEHVLLSNFDFISKHFTNQSTKDKIAYDLLKEFINNKPLEGIDVILAEFKTLQSDSTKYTELSDLVIEMSAFNAGNPAFDFTYPDRNGDSISLADFKGSLVYVDVWATWCGPCKREIPHLLELEKDYQGQNIVFLSVSVDEDENYDAWTAMLEEKEMGGVQLFASGWSKIAKDYKINGIPRFMLFDSLGNIINVRAPRPSNEGIRSLIDQHL